MLLFSPFSFSAHNILHEQDLKVSETFFYKPPFKMCEQNTRAQAETPLTKTCSR